MKLYFFIFFSSISSHIISQAYAVSSIPKQFDDLSAVTPLTSSSSWVNNEDDGYIGIEFIRQDFEYFGAIAPHLFISTNGVISFSEGILQSQGELLPTANSVNDLIGVWTDLELSLSSHYVKFQTSGVAPNRRFVVEYNTGYVFDATNTAKFQIKLFEASNTVEVHIEEILPNTFLTVGLENRNGTDAATSVNRESITVRNRAFRFEPVWPFPPSDLRLSNISANQLQVVWQDNSDNETGFVIERADLPSETYSEIGIVGQDVTSFLDVGVVANSEYKYRIKARNGGQVSVYSDRYMTFPDAIISDIVVREDVLTIDDNIIIGDLSLSLQIEHDFIGDLVVKLRHERTGKEITILDRGCSAGNNVSAVFSDFSSNAIDSNCGTDPGLVGELRAVQSLSLFRDDTLSGDWILSVEDTQDTFDGTLISWGLQASPKLTTVPNTPVATAASDTTENSFTGNWDIVNGAISYVAELSSVVGEDTIFISETDVLVNSLTVSDLDTGFFYVYRIKAVSPFGETPFSNYQGVTTLPKIPVVLEATDIDEASFLASWESSTGAASYRLDLFLQDDTPVPEYTNIAIDETSLDIEALEPETTYKYIVYSIAQDGTTLSLPSDTIEVTTLALDTTIPSISANNGTINIDGSNTFQFRITDESPLSVVNLSYRTYSDTSTWTLLTLPEPVEGLYTVNIPAEVVNTVKIGAEFRIEASDSRDNNAVATFQYRANFGNLSDLTVPASGQTKDFKIISVPADLTTNAISSVLKELGKHNDTNWRLFRHRGGENPEEYPKEFTTIEPGTGYWILSKKEGVSTVDIPLGSGQSVDATPTQPFVIQLNSGWNLIGNPFNRPLQICTFEDQLEEPLLIYSKESEAFIQSSTLGPSEGGYVWASDESSGQLFISTVDQCPPSGGRFHSGTTTESYSLGESAWSVDLKMVSPSKIYERAGFGMQPSASASYGEEDDIAPPHFFDYVEIVFENPKDYPITYDIRPPVGEYIWEFSVRSSFPEEEVQLHWDNSAFGNKKELLLIDKSVPRVVSMNKIDQYSFRLNKKRDFEILYGDYGSVENLMETDQTVISSNYPNPFTENTTFSYFVTSNTSEMEVELKLFGLNGKLVGSKKQIVNGGYHEFFLDKEDLLVSKAGIYLYEFSISAEGSLIKSRKGKMILSD